MIPKQEQIKKIADAGIVGLGGACFPTQVKLTPPPTAKAEVLVVNGVECEPFLTCDHRLMLEHGEDKIVRFPSAICNSSMKDVAALSSDTFFFIDVFDAFAILLRLNGVSSLPQMRSDL